MKLLQMVSVPAIVLATISLISCSGSPEAIIDSGDAVSGDGSAGDSSIDTASSDSSTDVKVNDLGPAQGEFGYPCIDNKECNSSFCTETPNGNVCTQVCVTDCPHGFTCTGVGGNGADVSYVCLSSFVRLCDPCAEHKDCNGSGKVGSLCVGAGDGGSFCGAQCNPQNKNTDCPIDYSCQFVTDVKSKLSGNQCVPSNGATCTCSMRATQLALKTDCANKNVFGSCKGQRVCKVEGLTNCVGQVPEAESCNKLDDNCDGETDNIDPKAIGGQCKQTNEFGTCFGVFTGCDAKGQPLCDALLPKPEICNGLDDNCNGKTDEGQCEDGNVCTIDQCNTDGSCKHTNVSGTACDDGDVCTTLEQCAAGKCVGGNVLNCNDNDACSIDSCDPLSGCKHKSATEGNCLDDGNACTQDVCDNGKCTHPKAKDGSACVDEGNVCTNDVCDNGDCVHNANSAKCDDGNQCTLNDSCKDKACVISLLKVCNDNNACTVDSCDPKKGCIYQPGEGSGIPCPDDGNSCTDDTCKGAQCAHFPIPGCS